MLITFLFAHANPANIGIHRRVFISSLHLASSLFLSYLQKLSTMALGLSRGRLWNPKGWQWSPGLGQSHISLLRRQWLLAQRRARSCLAALYAALASIDVWIMPLLFFHDLTCHCWSSREQIKLWVSCYFFAHSYDEANFTQTCSE